MNIRNLCFLVTFLTFFSNAEARVVFNGCSQNFQNLINWSTQVIVPRLNQIYRGDYNYFTHRETGQLYSFDMTIPRDFQNYISWLFNTKGFVVNCWNGNINPLCFIVEGVTPIHPQRESRKQLFLCETTEKLQNPCEMLMVFYHEFGHVAQLPMQPNHNQGIDALEMIVEHDDLVFKFGEAIYSMCRDLQ